MEVMQEFEIDGSGWHTVPGTNMRRPCQFLNKKVQAFYHGDYESGGAWERQGTIANLIWTLKNDTNPFPKNLQNAINQLKGILRQDLAEIQKKANKELTICVIPRAKNEQNYRSDQLNFKRTVCEIANELANFEDGISYIIRSVNTRTTHLDKLGGGGDGDTPYPGITKTTCTISDEIKGKDSTEIQLHKCRCQAGNRNAVSKAGHNGEHAEFRIRYINTGQLANHA